MHLRLLYFLTLTSTTFCYASRPHVHSSRHDLLSDVSVNTRASPLTCGVGKPCADNSCCNSVGQCGITRAICNGTATTSCISNCRDVNAPAACGENSLGNQKCGLNLCCSAEGYCGTSSLYCINSDPVHHTLPCQQGYGRCEIVTPPECGQSCTSASRGRQVGYWQATNVLYRACESISPAQIQATGLTHLNFAFVSISPITFCVIPANPGDVTLYRQFTALKSTKLEAWVSVGGGGFSSGATLTTWSDMTSSAKNRCSFIESLVNFMCEYGFQGVDIDWEFPGDPAYGGRAGDGDNLVKLVREMRVAFGKKFGISSTLPPDYYDLQNFSPKEMEPYLDFFNFMAFDLRGPWSASQTGAFVLPQTDQRDINTDILPLWFDNLIPQKVNLGIAYYGRGYTLSNTSCVTIGCPYSSVSNAGPCTRSPGVLSLREIEQLVSARKLTPYLDPNALVKIIVWDDDQWMAYDDKETIAMKTQIADRHCMGGTNIWSVDFFSGPGSGDPPTSVWDPPAAINSSTFTVSLDATCGSGTTFTCLKSDFGNCCSSSGFCGSTTAYCGGGCQVSWGLCGDETTPSVAPPV